MLTRNRLLRWVAAGSIASGILLTLPACKRSRDAQAASDPKGTAMGITITSSAFEANGPIPKRHTGDGEDVSPPLAWSNVPKEAKELALIMDDPDAPRKEPWVHWVLAGIPADSNSLPEGTSSAKAGKHPAGVVEGTNSHGVVGYLGPSPPPGKPHRYFFKIYALDQAMKVKGGLTKADLLAAMDGHILATGELIGTYQRGG